MKRAAELNNPVAELLAEARRNRIKHCGQSNVWHPAPCREKKPLLPLFAAAGYCLQCWVFILEWGSRQ
jgi:hypothetical protein